VRPYVLKADRYFQIGPDYLRVIPMSAGAGGEVAVVQHGEVLAEAHDQTQVVHDQW
jgi:hypothetical protein